jgi:glutamine synthetase
MGRHVGMLGQEELERSVASGEIDTVVVAFTDHYGRLHGKRFDASHFLDVGFDHGTHGCDYLLTVDMEMEPVPGYRYANWEAGYGDFHMAPDPTTLRAATWLDRTALVLCDLRDTHTGELVSVAPRSILRRQLEQAATVGFTFKAASELEYFLYTDSYREAAESKYQDLTPAGWYIEDYHLLQGTREEFYNGKVRRHLSSSGIPVENSKGEWGRGQHEMNIKFAELLDMADRHTIMKQAMKEIADGTGVSVTFMAKPTMEDAGSSCHLHVSVWEGDHNAFPGDHPVGPVRASDIFRWFLGGWMARAAELMVFMAPTVNSYKRYQDGSWAPTRLAWSYDNRTAGFRVVGHDQSLRIECRIPGADVNPYLAYAGVIAAGLEGIANQVEPPDIFEGDVYQAESVSQVPKTLREATELFAGSEFVRDAFGADVQEHYTHFFRSEQAAFDNAVTDWERIRYFERI